MGWKESAINRVQWFHFKVRCRMRPSTYVSSSAGTALSEGVRQTRPIFIGVLVFSLFINLLMFVSPLYMLQIYDRVIVSRSESTLFVLTLLAAFLLLVYAVLEVLRSRLLVRAGLVFDHFLGRRVFEAVHQGNLRSPGAGHSQCLRDLDVLREFFTGAGLIALCDAPWLPIFIYAAFLLHPYFGYLAIFAGSITFFLTVLTEFVTKNELSSASRASFMEGQSAQSTFRNTEVLQAMGMLGTLKNAWFSHHHSKLFFQALASDRAGIIIAFTKFFRMFLQTAILGTGAYLVIQRELSPGGMIAASILIGRALQPLELVVANWKGFISARSSYFRLRSLFELVGTEVSKMDLPPPIGAIDLEEVVVAPPGAPSAIVLKGISLKILAGDVIGVVGPSAAGKSSLARVLVGVWPTLRGVVRLDGADLKHWNAAALGGFIGYLPQDVELFSGTVAQNIARFQEIDSEAVVEAARLAGCHELIQGLANGYNTQIGDSGASLSGGQRQRIGLARALYGNPRLIVLDEPNAHLDSAGEEALLSAVPKIKSKGATVILITHKINILAAVDKVLVMGEGLAKVFGPRDAVLQQLMGPRIVSPDTQATNRSNQPQVITERERN